MIKEIEKELHFHDSHNISTNQPKGVMPVSVARRMFKECFVQMNKDIEDLRFWLKENEGEMTIDEIIDEWIKKGEAEK